MTTAKIKDTPAPIPTAERILVPASRAAELLSMGQSTFWREVAARRLPAGIKIGGMTRWRVADLQRAFVADGGGA